MNLTNLPAPFAPLVSGGEGLDRYPTEPIALGRRMAEVYGVPAECVLPVRGVTHGLELVFRLAARDGGKVEAPDAEPYRSLAALYARPADQAETAAVILPAAGSPESVADRAARVAPALLVVDEGDAEFAEAPSAAATIAHAPNLIVLRSLSLAYGLAGARVGAALGQPEALARLASVLEPYALPEVSVRLALQALDPSRLMETSERLGAVRRERARLVEALSPAVAAEPGSGASLMIRPSDPDSVPAALARYGVTSQRDGDRLRLPVSARREVNDRLLAALCLASSGGRPHRTGQAVRDTRETRIVCAVDLDAPGPVSIRTGVGFFDHMLEQVAAPRRTGAARCRRGIARYGFVLPMDEAEAKVSIDLSGRPYPVFEGGFATPFIGDYRTDLTAHVFRSLAEHLGAAIHVSVTGQDDHHKTEACYKAFGRALRQATRVEDEAIPSTKGVL